MTTSSQKSSSVTQGGVALLETLIAILVFSLGVLGVIGLQAAMIKHTGDARYRIEAAYLAQQRLGAMWMDQSNLASYVETATDISALLPEGTRSVTVDGTRQVTVTVTWQQPGATETHNYETTTRIGGGT
jgi:type IV pilus assembly protein PilV